MRNAILSIAIFLLVAMVPRWYGETAAAPQSARVVDRIAARIEDDIILESQVRELGAFQRLVEGRSDSEDKLLDELIEQWVVETEATASHFPPAAQSEVGREMKRLVEQTGEAGKYEAQLSALGLSDDDVRALLARQIFVERYLDYKFRPSVQVATADVDAYYKNELVPELARKNKPPPAPSVVDEQIREVLVQRGISDLTTKWLEDTKSRLKIEIEEPAVSQ